MSWLEVEHLPARAQREAEALDDGGRANPSAAGRCRKEVAPAIHGVDVGRIGGHDGPAALRSDTRHGDGAWAHLEASLALVDQLAPLGGIVLGKQQTDRNTSELGVAVVALAV